MQVKNEKKKSCSISFPANDGNSMDERLTTSMSIFNLTPEKFLKLKEEKKLCHQRGAAEDRDIIRWNQFQ